MAGQHTGQNDFLNGQAGLNRPKIIAPLILLIITAITISISGALYTGADLIHDPASIITGLPLSISLLFILGTHEFGHYLAARRHGVETTLPMFIPGPPLPPMLGTFGAIIRIKSPISTKNSLVDIGASGPLAGFIVAIIVTIIGLKHSAFVDITNFENSFALGEPLIFDILKGLIIGVTPAGKSLMLSPIAYAGWIGFLVTAINLLPIGQLDGGHLVYAILGKRHRIFSIAMIACLMVLGYFYWPGWYIWGALIAVLALKHPPVSDQARPLDAKRIVVIAACLAVFILTFMPAPFYII